MSEYDQYIGAINKIYTYLEAMKKAWPNQDNLNYIENIDTYRQIVINNAALFKETNKKLEELGNE